ncbi:beta-xylosidase [Microbacterium sp. SSW1-59]|uniref:GH39 family glycosyl hydrolase n=1 Tax=Microbacterium xanthum TaxID=3079794 RepID=UPI002AD1E510|nr:beta-xylosidase [Microbacterium sp. SSW1-59]MDZ8200368.1 beta-xylosidase [Microbacterium sp. SSW1-59]
MADLTVDAHAPGERFSHHWSLVVGAGRANEGLRADWQRQLREVAEVQGFRYVRFHGLFHDDMFVYREDAQGRLDPSFQYIDTLFDAMLDAGVRPFVEFGFMPSQLATATRTAFWWGANCSPPTDFDAWERLIRLTVEHWRDRYGIDEIRQWYFEVWNEPNLRPFFHGTKSEYIELYRRTARAVKSVDGALPVGGPATSNFVPDTRFDGETEDTSAQIDTREAPDLDALDWKPVWLEEFLGIAASEGLPLDFVSTHPYPTDWALDEHGQGARLTRGVDATPADLRLLRSLVDASAFPDAEIHLTEWSSSSSSRDRTHDYPQAATYVVKANLDSIGLVDSLSYWTFTDIFEEEGGGQLPFHGGFGMLSYHGIPKPTYHGYRFLAALGDDLLTRSSVGAITRDSTDGAISAVVYNYPDEVTQTVPASFDTRENAERTLATGSARTTTLRVTGVRPGTRFRVELLSPRSGNAIARWDDLGSPLNPTRDQIAAIRESANDLRRWELVAGPDGLDAVIDLPAWGVALVTQLR